MLSEARVSTTRPAVYLQRLCKHFAVKIAVESDDEQGTAHFPMGDCHLRVEPETLVMHAEAADAESLAQIQAIVADHLERFGHHDRLKVSWSQLPIPTPDPAF